MNTDPKSATRTPPRSSTTACANATRPPSMRVLPLPRGRPICALRPPQRGFRV